MKVICEYCGSEFESEQTGTCPNCGGLLTDAEKKEKERAERLAYEERLRREKREDEAEARKAELEAQRAKQEAEDRENERWFRLVLSVLGGGVSPFSGIQRSIRRFKYNLKSFFKFVVVVAIAIAIIFLYKAVSG